MFTVSRGIPVNAEGVDGPRLSRADVWRGLVLKADNALPFVPRMTTCDVTHRAPTWLTRDVVFRDEPAGERVTFLPQEEVRFERTSGATMGTIRNQILEEDGRLTLRFTFSLEREGLAHGSPEEQAHAKEMEGAYMAAVDATLGAIRQFTAEHTGSSAVEVAASPEVVSYVERVVEDLARGNLDQAGARYTEGATAHVGSHAAASGSAEAAKVVADALGPGGPHTVTVEDAWHAGDLIGCRLAVDGEPAVHLLHMQGDLIVVHRVIGR